MAVFDGAVGGAGIAMVAFIGNGCTAEAVHCFSGEEGEGVGDDEGASADEDEVGGGGVGAGGCEGCGYVGVDVAMDAVGCGNLLQCVRVKSAWNGGAGEVVDCVAGEQTEY